MMVQMMQYSNSMAHCCDARGNSDHCDSVKLPGYVNCIPKVKTRPSTMQIDWGEKCSVARLD